MTGQGQQIVAVALWGPTPGLELRWNLLCRSTACQPAIIRKMLRLGRRLSAAPFTFLSQKTDNMELLLVLEWLPRISPRFPVIAAGSAYVQSHVAGFVQRSFSRSRSC